MTNGSEKDYVVVTSADGGETALEYLADGNRWSVHRAAARVFPTKSSAEGAAVAWDAPHVIRVVPLKACRPNLGAFERLPRPMQFRGVVRSARERLAEMIAGSLRESS